MIKICRTEFCILKNLIYNNLTKKIKIKPHLKIILNVFLIDLLNIFFQYTSADILISLLSYFIFIYLFI